MPQFAYYNDEGFSFAQIAAVIEENADALFVKEES